MKKILAILIAGFIILIPKTALAVVDTEFGPVSGVAEYVSNIMAWLLPIVGGLALLMMIYAGYLYMTSQGNPEATGRAKDIIIGVVTGIILLFLIKIILDQIGIK